MNYVQPPPLATPPRPKRGWIVALVGGSLLLMVLAPAAVVGSILLFRHLVQSSQNGLVTDVLQQNQLLRDQVCQRRTADLGDVDLEDVTPADVPGNSERTRSTATAIAHPPGQPVCRAVVHFVIQQHLVSSNGKSSTYETTLVEVQVGTNPAVGVTNR